MADAAIHAAIKIIGETLAKELFNFAISKISALDSNYENLEANMNMISGELKVIQGFLNDTETYHENIETQVAWKTEVQKIAIDIENIVDEFAYLIGNKKFVAMSFYVAKLFKKPRLLVDFNRIASQLLQVDQRLNRVARMKNQWLTDTQIGNNSNEYSRSAADSTDHFIVENNIVGNEKNRQVITDWVICKKQKLSVISVWGMVGVGKTTLVTNVLNRESKNFDSYAWVSISQSYTINNILGKMISEICKNKGNDAIDTTNMDLRGLKECLRGLLKELKYLIFLDDIWDIKAYHDLEDTLIENHKDSRIVITSRMAQVANLASESNTLELKPLSEKQSWELFCRKAFRNEQDHECPPELVNCARDIVSMCDGLPLALVSFGAVLSVFKKKESEWKRLFDQFSWYVNNNTSLGLLKNTLNLSFNYLPRYLKYCFLYCGLFPKDYVLARKKLIRLWVAEGFVEKKGSSTLEEVAEGYLMELIDRSMLQVVRENYFGRVKACQMHGTLRELAIHLCRKENFGLLHVANKSENVDSSTRRLSIIKLRETIQDDVCLPKLRTFLSADNDVPSSPFLSIIFKSRYLAVLDLEGLPIETVPNTIGDLFNLRYLGLRRTHVKLLPKSIKKLHNLQTLDLLHSKIEKLPDGISKLKSLRHLFAEVLLGPIYLHLFPEVQLDPIYRSFQAHTGISLPKDMFYLKELQTIQALESNAIVVREIGNLTQLRSFQILNVMGNHSTELCRSLSRMSSLTYLSINASDEKEILQLEDLKLPQLRKLVLCGQLIKTMFKSPLFKQHGDTIEMLRLGWSQLPNDPLSYISDLKNLTYLQLQKAYEGNELTFQAGLFPKLKILRLGQMANLVKIEMEHNTMRSLEEIWLWELEQLVAIPTGIEQLSSLRQMYCIDMPDNFGGLAKGNTQRLHFMCNVF